MRYAASRQKPPAGSLFLDHVSHFVPDLGAAAQVLEALGLAVTPESAQRTQEGPAGTSNVCVMLEAGYLEFLAPTHDTPNAQRLRAAMQRYAGVHLVCFGTPAAEEEQARLAAHGFGPLPVVNLERPVAIDGRTVQARFNVVRVPPERMPEGRVQFVEQLTPEAIWQPRYLAHANGVTGLACAFVVAEDPIVAGARWARFAALLPRPAGRFVHLRSARGDVLIGRRADWEAIFADETPAPPALAGCALECRDPDALAERAALAGAAIRKIRPRLYAASLPPALGGAWVFGTRKSLALDS
jgi:hypothetical protein